MSNTSIPQLVLYPKSVARAPDDLQHLLAMLKQTGLIADSDDQACQLPGKDFLNQLTFLGCSPEIQLSPEDGEKFCRISFSNIETKAVCLGHTSSIKPKCPACKKTISNWQQTEDWQQADSLLHCVHCNTDSAMHELKWRHECAYGRFALCIHYIHPHEAVPSETLLEALHRITGFDWDYCYITQQVNL
ncbi:MAG: hypothetical protein EP315_06595 [Gammaproteobacteria bacterium]|nr:MAG: hypothetical protein EP315_06595 [Gammaproteobacteria bacterium]